MRRSFYRNVRARDYLETFLIAAVSSLLLLRFALSITGYPQISGHGLHIAHMLFGGLLMMTAIVIAISFLGARADRLASIVGGAGFGIFIDELGKFITKDNNYFFRPTIGIIYAIFIILYLAFNFISRPQKLSSEEYQLNALRELEEAVLHDMDQYEKDATRRLLERADQGNIITKELLNLLEHIKPVPESKPNRFRQWLAAADRQYERFWRRRSSRRLVGLLFVVEALVFLAAVLGTMYNNFDNIGDLLKTGDSYANALIVGQLLSSLVAAAFAVAGALRLLTSRVEAFEMFRRAVLVNLFLTEFFIFSRIQLGALPGFIVNLLLFFALRYALHEEQRVRTA